MREAISDNRRPRNTRTSQESTAQSNNADDQIHESDIIAQPGTGPLSQEQCVEDMGGVHTGFTMVEGRCIEVDNESILAQWDCANDNTRFEATEEISQDIVDRPLSANNFTDPFAFHHMGARFPMSSYAETNFTGYTERRFSCVNPIATPQTVAYSTFPSYNAAHARIPYQTTYNSPITAIHSQPATTLEDEPVTNQFQLSEWMYEHRVEEMSFADRMARYNYDL
ncbi:hypothetical protein OCU04_001947 [Sclerotinia nivalis]|uniref:Uncharacterized protein n=1 Tax=Sclerotinia nivalis TaxID=352851 RepID=A0A9X0DPY4_9HELO|nr:hypothetical protein OCU04_001947 [Sclerotinia nivalis]